MDYLDKLRSRLWKESIGTENRIINRTYCEQISNQISARIEKKINWETVRDFLEGNRKTSLPTLNKISAFVFDDPNATYQHFVELCDELTDQQVVDDIPEKESENQNLPPSFLNSKQRRVTMASLAFVLLGSFMIISLSSGNENQSNTSEVLKNGEYYEVGFEGLNLDSLLNNGWDIKDKDLTLLDKYKDYPFLTLGTEIGDYFKQPGADGRIVKIKNLLYRKINCGGCCTITLKLKNFHPQKPHQSAGFLLFYGDSIDPEYYTRLSYSKGNKKDVTLGTTVVRPLFYDYKSKEYQINRRPRHIDAIKLPWELDQDLITDSIWIRAHINNGIYSFLYKRNRFQFFVTPPQNKGHDLKLPSPTMIAIGAWQGHSVDSAHLVAVDTIPVTFDQLTIEPCFE